MAQGGAGWVLQVQGCVAGARPLGDAPKRQVALRLDRDVLDRFREGGPGWQSRINAVLRGAVGL